MNKKEMINKIAIFEDKEIRKKFVNGEWVFSVIDVVGALTESENPNDYWYKMKIRTKNEDGVELSTICRSLKMPAPDGKNRLTDVANTEALFRIIQSIPSPKAEPFKRWLARVGKERLDEIEQPGKAIERAKGYYIEKGYDPKWVQTRTASIDTRHRFTDALKETGIKEKTDYAILTNEMYSSTFGMTAEQYKKYKELRKQDSLRDNMTPIELAATIFSEATSTEFIKQSGTKNFIETKDYIIKAGSITNEAIKKIEKETGKKVVTKENYRQLNLPEKQKEIIRKSLKELETSTKNTNEDLTD
jgi:DNA-damage-inducible protein D